MYSTIAFPYFGIEVNPPRSFSIGPLEIYFYGVLIALGLMLAVIYGMRRSKQFGIKDEDILDGVLWVTPLAILFARAYYCIFSWEEYAADPISVLYIWNGGLAIYGGVIGAALGVVLHCKIKKIRVPALLDLVSIGFLIGQCIGRWGNFFNREAFGGEYTGVFCMALYNDTATRVEYHHPTFLYESVWNLIGFILLHKLSKKRKYDGQIALGYVAWYGFGRAMIEGLRTDSLYLGPIRVSQLLAALSCAAAVGILIWQHFKPHDRLDLFVNREEKKAAMEAALAEEATDETESAEAEEEAVTEPAAEEAAAEAETEQEEN